MKIYLAGPMTGIPQFNIPAFDRFAAGLAADNHEIINPAAEDPPEVRAAALASETGDLAALEAVRFDYTATIVRCVQAIMDGAEAIALMPDWERSRGARIEASVAVLNGKRAYVAHEGRYGVYLTPVTTYYVLSHILGAAT